MNQDNKQQIINILAISTGVGLIAATVSWLAWDYDIIFKSISMFFLELNVLPFLIAALAESPHSPNMPIFYILTFVQWFLLTLLFFWIKKRFKIKVKKR